MMHSPFFVEKETFPLFMLTFIPAAVCAVFAKRGWEPTRHTVAIGIGSLAAAPRE